MRTSSATRVGLSRTMLFARSRSPTGSWERARSSEDLARSQLPVGDRERAKSIVRDKPTRVADDVRIPDREPEEARRVEPRVHAGHDRHLACGRRRELRVRETGGVSRVRAEQLLL